MQRKSEIELSPEQISAIEKEVRWKSWVVAGVAITMFLSHRVLLALLEKGTLARPMEIEIWNIVRLAGMAAVIGLLLLVLPKQEKLYRYKQAHKSD